MISILCILPYIGLKKSVLRIANNFTDLKIDCYIGDLGTGLELVKKYQYGHYDAIISRYNGTIN